jgi:hypothetical protein
MSIELPVRPASDAVEQATEVIGSGVAKAGASLGAVIDRLGELDLDEGLRDAAMRLRSEADDRLKDFDVPGERDRVALVAATFLVIVVILTSVFLVRQRTAPAPKPARKAPRRRRS